jgi:tetratricopeptide (TPR) repeat protein
MLALLLTSALAFASPQTERRCNEQKAQDFLEQGMALQSELESESALEKYRSCLAAEPGCLACTYESGWSYWKLGLWQNVVDAWEKVLAKNPDDSEVQQFLPTARENLALVKVKKMPATFVTGRLSALALFSLPPAELQPRPGKPDGHLRCRHPIAQKRAFRTGRQEGIRELPGGRAHGDL